MPKVKVKGRIKKFPYTKKGMRAARKARMPMKLSDMMMGNKMK